MNKIPLKLCTISHRSNAYITEIRLSYTVCIWRIDKKYGMIRLLLKNTYNYVIIFVLQSFFGENTIIQRQCTLEIVSNKIGHSISIKTWWFNANANDLKKKGLTSGPLIEWYLWSIRCPSAACKVITNIQYSMNLQELNCLIKI